MKEKTIKTAQKRVLEGKASKSDLETLIMWAKTKIDYWKMFKLICERRLKNYDR